MKEIEARDPGGIAIVEAAILIETGSYVRFRKIILTVCSREEQIRRAVDRGGLSREDAEARLDSQMPLAEKRRFADYVIDTSGTKDDTLRKVEETYNLLRSIPQ